LFEESQDPNERKESTLYNPAQIEDDILLNEMTIYETSNQSLADSQGKSPNIDSLLKHNHIVSMHDIDPAVNIGVSKTDEDALVFVKEEKPAAPFNSFRNPIMQNN